MLTQKFAFFSFMLGWSLIAGRATGIPFPIVLYPILVTVSGWRYSVYFIVINLIVIIPNMVASGAFTYTYLQSLTPVLTHVNQITSISNMTLRQQIMQNYTNHLISNYTAGTPFQTIINSIAVDSSHITPYIITADIIMIPIFIGVLYLMGKGFIKALKAFLKMYRMVEAVTQHGGQIKSSRTSR